MLRFRGLHFLSRAWYSEETLPRYVLGYPLFSVISFLPFFGVKSKIKTEYLDCGGAKSANSNGKCKHCKKDAGVNWYWPCIVHRVQTPESRLVQKKVTVSQLSHNLGPFSLIPALLPFSGSASTTPSFSFLTLRCRPEAARIFAQHSLMKSKIFQEYNNDKKRFSVF